MLDALKRDFRRIDTRQARIVLVEAGPRLVPMFHPSLSQSATDRAQRDERRLKQAAEQVEAAAKAAAAEAKVEKLKQAAREGVAVPQKKPPRSKKGA